MRSVIVTLVLVLVAPLTCAAADAPYEEGVQYFQLVIPVRTRDPNRIEVTEYFSYGCPHCFDFDPVLRAWTEQLGPDVVFDRTPAIWNTDYEVFAQTYYTAEALGIREVVHPALFGAIHVEHRNLADPRAMADFFSEFGVDPLDFAKVYTSFGVRASVQQAEARGRSYRASGIPAIIVDGKYRVETSESVDQREMLRVVDFLVDRERAARAAARTAPAS